MQSVLIVEDEIFIALEIERVVQSAGHEVVAIAADHAEAARFAGRTDLAFVDVNLRDGATGPQIAHELAQHGTKIVFVTANPAQIGEAPPTMTGCISKPFTDDQIVAAIKTAAVGGQ